ncbi:TPA: DUF2574 family protein [Citrobacter gillenii]
MKKSLLMGIIALTYGMSSSTFASDTATLTISGRVVEPTCSADIVNNNVQQRCGQSLHLSNVSHVDPVPAKGVVTEVISVPGNALRQIVLNRYD